MQLLSLESVKAGEGREKMSGLGNTFKFVYYFFLLLFYNYRYIRIDIIKLGMISSIYRSYESSGTNIPKFNWV